ncbi:MAG: type B 50S ribosomal protein L31 [Chlamydiota bacterium]|nr:type B 50S ribosomal protein L31 [Chlamydiota bacterium]
MKKDTHPKYQQVLFVDSSTGHKFVCGSTLCPEETGTFEGKDYPVCHVPVSSASHPLFTGSKQFVDAEGRVDKFRKRYAAKPAAAKDNDGEGKDGQSKEEKPKKKPAAKKAKKADK